MLLFTALQKTQFCESQQIINYICIYTLYWKAVLPLEPGSPANIDQGRNSND